MSSRLIIYGIIGKVGSQVTPPRPICQVEQRRARLVLQGGAAELVQKKISLSGAQLAWEHERFNIRKLRAVTYSRLATAEQAAAARTSMLDTRYLLASSSWRVDNSEV